MQQLDIKKTQARLFLEYGINLDETSIVILSILSREQAKQFAVQHQKTDKAIEELHTASNQINQSQRSLQVDSEHPRWQAFWFGMGKWGFSMIFLISLASIMGMIYLSEQKKKEKIEQEWIWYKNYYDSVQNSNYKESEQRHNNYSKRKSKK